jgi:SulP family sulfate permease
VATGKDNEWLDLLNSLMRGWRETRGASRQPPLDPFPLRHTLRDYSWRKLKADVYAAVNVALLDLPQGMAYAAVAGLPLQYGPTCSAVSAGTGPLLSSSRQTILGPTNATAFMVFSYFAAFPDLDRLALMPLLVFMVGLLLILGAYLRVADLAQYISRTVVVAYVSGAAILIMANQLPHVLGITLMKTVVEGVSEAPRTLPGIVVQLFRQLTETQWQSLLVSALTVVIWWLTKRLRPAWPAFAIALIGGAICARITLWAGFDVVTFADAKFSWRTLLPPFPEFTSLTFLHDFSRLFGLAVAVAFLATLESSAMAKNLASRSGENVDANQDMLSLGVANLACAYLSGMPASGSLTRSALNYHAGAQTPMASVFNGFFCLIGALTLGPLIGYLPRASLAVLVILVAVSLLNRRHIRISLLATNSDAIVFFITFIATLLVPLNVAIFTGVGVSIILYLRKASRPSLVEYEFNQEGHLAEALPGVRRDPSISIVHVEGELFFGAAELFRTQVQRICADPNLRIIILRLKNARHLDATSVMALEDLVKVMRANGRDLIVSGAMKEVYRVLRDSKLVETIGRNNIFPGSAANPNLATKHALKRAQEILGSDKAEIHIYYDPAKGRV